LPDVLDSGLCLSAAAIPDLKQRGGAHPKCGNTAYGNVGVTVHPLKQLDFSISREWLLKERVVAYIRQRAGEQHVGLEVHLIFLGMIRLPLDSQRPQNRIIF